MSYSLSVLVVVAADVAAPLAVAELQQPSFFDSPSLQGFREASDALYHPAISPPIVNLAEVAVVLEIVRSQVLMNAVQHELHHSAAASVLAAIKTGK